MKRHHIAFSGESENAQAAADIATAEFNEWLAEHRRTSIVTLTTNQSSVGTDARSAYHAYTIGVLYQEDEQAR